MSAHYDGGEVIEGRRLREVEVAYVEDPTLDMGRDDDDDGVISPPVSCIASPKPPLYLTYNQPTAMLVRHDIDEHSPRTT
jgi:hypothetical protein